MKIKRMLLIAFPVIILLAFGFAYYEYNKPKPDITELKAAPVTAVNLFQDYSANESKANRLYLNKAVQVTGKVLDVKQGQDKHLQIILDAGDPMFGVACTMDKTAKDSKRTAVRPGDQVTVKGICSGFLNDVVLVSSILVD